MSGARCGRITGPLVLQGPLDTLLGGAAGKALSLIVVTHDRTVPERAGRVVELPDGDMVGKERDGRSRSGRDRVESTVEVASVVVEPSRRRFPRISTDKVVLVTTIGDADAEQLARARNVSLGGCQVVVDRHLRRGTMVQVLVRVDDQVVDALGRVVYELQKGGKVEAGIEFLYLSEPDRRRIEQVLANGPNGAGAD